MRAPIVTATAALLFAAFAGQLWFHATRSSVTIDEPTHIFAGYRYLRCGDFGSNKEHPPLLKLVAAAPLLAMELRDPLGPCRTVDAPPAVAFTNGGDFLAMNGIDRVVVPTRVAASIFALLLAAFVFAAVHEMFGPVPALVALAVIAFEPTLIAHGSLVTTDMAVATMLFGSVYFAWRYLERPGAARLVVLGVATGLTLAAKHSGLVVLPIVGLMLLQKRRFRAIGAVGAIAVFVLCATYAFDPRPYFEGFRVLAENRDRPMWLFDGAYASGQWFYFPVVFAIKASLATLVLTPLAFRSKRFLRLIPLVFIAISMASTLNIGVRHILPVWPFLIAGGAAGACTLARRTAARAVLVALLVLHAMQTIAIAPAYLAFANGLWGGTNRSWRMFKDSNVEWGQGLHAVDRYVASNGIRDCWFAAYGNGMLNRMQQPCRPLPAFGWNAGREPVEGIPPVLRGTVLLSATVLPPRGGPEYAPFSAIEPATVIDGCVLVYEGEFRVPLLSAITWATRARQLAASGRSDEAAQAAAFAIRLAPGDARVRRLVGY